MKHVETTKVGKEAVPDGVVFCIHNTPGRRSSPFVLVPGAEAPSWCLAVNIKGKAYTSDWHPQDLPEGKADKVAAGAFLQIMYIKRNGWYRTDEMMLDDIGMFREQKYRCAYCNAETIAPKKGPCGCRPVARLARGQEETGQAASGIFPS